MSRREYSNEEKASVLAALLEGQAVSQVAKKYKIPEGTIAGWKSMLLRGRDGDLVREKRERIGDLLVEYLEANLMTLRIQVEGVFRDEGWLREQEAAQLATLHGVTTDKAIRLLEALGGSGEDELTEDES